MVLPITLLALLLTYCTASPANYTTTLNFDALPTPSHGLSALPTPLPDIHLTFSPRFSLFTPTSPSLANFISPHDTNCASSPPNALLGSRACEECPGASFEIDGKNAEVMRDEGLRSWFELVGMRVKPLAAPESEVGTNLTIRGWRMGEIDAEGNDDGDGDGEVLEWSVVFPYGFWDMFEVRIEEFSGRRWDRLWKVEVSARYGDGEDMLDWEVCVDDLVVGFEGAEKGRASLEEL